MSVKVDPVVIDEIFDWLLGWICGPVVQLFWSGWGLVEACDLGDGFGLPLGCCLGCSLGVCDMWEEGRSLESEFGGHGHCCMG